MRYRLELRDPWQRPLAVFSEDLELEATRALPDREDRLRCTLPHVPGLGPGCGASLYLDGALWRAYAIARTAETWNADLQLEHNTRPPRRDRMTIEGSASLSEFNTPIRRIYADARLDAIVRDVVHRAPGPLHLTVDHNAYPDGAQREFGKLIARINSDNELEQGGITQGQWVGADRVDASQAYAKDGDTIAGLRVDGAPWPDLRLLMIDAEETALNSHARKRHPETAFWNAARYANSGYRRRAELARDALQQLMTQKGISHIELNPHRDASGAYDDRVDAYGRYVGMVHGGGECFNAALVELGLADVYLYADGQYHVPEHELKDFFSYAGSSRLSNPENNLHVEALDLDGGALDALTLFAWLANEHVFSVSCDGAVVFGAPTQPDHVIAYRADQMSVCSGFDGADLLNWVALSGHARIAPNKISASRSESIAAYGLHARGWTWPWLGGNADKQHLAQGMLADLAYPTPQLTLTFFHGATGFHPGELVALSGAPLERLAPRLPGEWTGDVSSSFCGRIVEVRQRILGDAVQTQVVLGAPLRSMARPLAALGRLHARDPGLFGFTLDDSLCPLDSPSFELH
jgi:endonuclease YncB( thermonuclease family)